MSGKAIGPIFIMMIICLAAMAGYGQKAPDDAIEATTKDGRPVILKPDGTWEFKKFERLGVTAAGFAALEVGMSYRTVVEILGREGEVVSSSNIATVTVMYQWKADKGSRGGNMNATFQDGKLAMKAQFGLK